MSPLLLPCPSELISFLFLFNHFSEDSEMKGCMSVVRLLYLTGSLLMKELSHSVGDRFLFFQVIYSISFSLGSLSPKQKGQSFLLLFGVLWVFFFLAMHHVGSSFPNQGLNMFPLYWKPGILTTGPSGKFWSGALQILGLKLWQTLVSWLRSGNCLVVLKHRLWKNLSFCILAPLFPSCVTLGKFLTLFSQL